MFTSRFLACRVVHLQHYLILYGSIQSYQRNSGDNIPDKLLIGFCNTFFVNLVGISLEQKIGFWHIFRFWEWSLTFPDINFSVSGNSLLVPENMLFVPEILPHFCDQITQVTSTRPPATDDKTTSEVRHSMDTKPTIPTGL